MSNVISRYAGVAFTGMLIWLGSLGAPATAAGVSKIDVCGIVSPIFEPMALRRAPLDAVKVAGGAKLRSLVAAPCPFAGWPFDA